MALGTALAEALATFAAWREMLAGWSTSYSVVVGSVVGEFRGDARCISGATR
jgi:hypothetical protein